MHRWIKNGAACALVAAGLLPALAGAQAHSPGQGVPQHELRRQRLAGGGLEHGQGDGGASSLADKIDLQVQVAGPNAQKQIQQINAMVQAGAKAIVIFPISPTALNQVVRSACAKRVLVFAYDGEITEPCVHNVTIDQEEAGRVTAQWLADKLGGKGRVVMVTGVPGTSVDTQHRRREEGVRQVSGHQGGGRGRGHVSQAVARTELSKLLATRSWNDIDGLWMQVGCYTANAMQLEAGRKPGQLLPCAGEGSNGGRVQMLPAGTAADGATGSYAPMGAPRISYASPPYSGALALKLAVQALEGKDVPKRVTLPLPLVTNDTIKLCQEGSWAEMKAGCNAFAVRGAEPGLVRVDLFGRHAGGRLNAALSAQPEK